MRYIARTPQDNSNTSKTHPVVDFFFMLAAVIVCVAIIYFLLGLALGFTVSRISPERESKWFRNSFVSEYALRSVSAGAELKPFEYAMLVNLQRCSGVTVDIDLHLLSSNEANAVALPGGNIVIFKGLLDQVQSENGLSFILAHELAHFAQRDHLYAMGRGLSLLSLSALISGGNSSATKLLSSVFMVEQAQYSQSREAKADEQALDILNCAYGHVGGADEFFKASLEQQQGFYQGVSHYFESHPRTRERIAELNRLTIEHQYRRGQTLKRQP